MVEVREEEEIEEGENKGKEKKKKKSCSKRKVIKLEKPNMILKLNIAQRSKVKNYNLIVFIITYRLHAFLKRMANKVLNLVKSQVTNSI